MKIEILNLTMDRTLESLSTVFEEGFPISSKTRKWSCRTSVVLYCCDMLKSKDMSGIKYDQTFLLCVRYLPIWDDLFALKCGRGRLDCLVERENEGMRAK